MLIFSSIICSHGVFVDLAQKVESLKLIKYFVSRNLLTCSWGVGGPADRRHHNDILSIDQTDTGSLSSHN